jgi:hypothetical protein
MRAELRRAFAVFDRLGAAPWRERAAFTLWSLAWSSPLGYRVSTRLARLGQPLAGLAGPAGLSEHPSVEHHLGVRAEHGQGRGGRRPARPRLAPRVLERDLLGRPVRDLVDVAVDRPERHADRLEDRAPLGRLRGEE